MTLAVGSHVEVGQVMVAISEPHSEGLREYHRWFESDHMYSAVLVGPGAFSANRYMATRELKALRAPRDGGVFDPVTGRRRTEGGHWVQALRVIER